MRFRFHPVFRMYGSPIPTCDFDFFPPSARTVRQSLHAVSIASPLSARTARQFLPALSASYRFPHVPPADFYLCFRFPPIFRMYGSLIPTCAFGFLPFSARTARQSLHALSTSPRLPHVHPADSYMRLRPRRVFRTYTPSIPTCTFGFLPFSACTARSPHVGFALPVRDTEAKAPIGCNCLNCLNV